MCVVVDVHEVVEGDVGVALRRREAGVPEQFLYGAQVRAAFQHVRGEGVAQGVRGKMLRQPGVLAEFVEDARRLTPVETPARSEERR